MSRKSSTRLRERGSRAALRLGNMVRRVVVAASQGAEWGLQGYAIPDLRGGDGFTIEGDGDEPVEVFQGIGIIARPAAGDNAEALVLQVGAEAEHQIFGAMRNEAARARYVEEFGEPAAGEIAIFNSAGSARVLVRADGTVEITAASGQEILLSAGGSTEPLVRKSDFDGHTHGALGLTAPGGGGPVTGQTAGATAVPGTSVVKGE